MSDTPTKTLEEIKKGLKEAMAESKKWRQEWYEKTVLNHPYVKELIASGAWDKMSSIGQRWIILDHVCEPWTLEGWENYKNYVENKKRENAEFNALFDKYYPDQLDKLPKRPRMGLF
jgi:hypothetical protein